MHMKKRCGLAIALALSLLMQNSAAADTLATDYVKYRQVYQSGNYDQARCWFVKAELRHPSVSSAYAVDYNSYTRARSGTLDFCGTPYVRPVNYLGVKAILYVNKSSGLQICRSFDWVYNNASSDALGIGAGVNLGDLQRCGTGDFFVIGYAYSLWNGAAETSSAVSPKHFFYGV